jgi:lipoate-protein ligase A
MMDVLCWSAPTVAENIAFDESVARSAFSTGRRLLRFWWGGPAAVVMGSSERAEQAVNSAACGQLGVDVLKRCTGGGTVLQTGGVLNYSLVTPAPDRLDLMAGFRLGTDLIRALLEAFGVAGTVQGTSDVAVAGRKISGNAQARRWRSLLVHGTLLVDFDFDLAEKVLLHPPREPEYRRARRHRDFLVTLRALGVKPDRKTIESAALHAGLRIFGAVGSTRPAEEVLHGMLPEVNLQTNTTVTQSAEWSVQ